MTHAALSVPVALAILLVFGVAWVAVGAWLGRAARGLDDYALAGRQVGLAFAVATAMATWVTTNTTMAAPQLAYQLGIWGMIGYSLGAVGLLLFAPLAGRIKRLLPGGFTSGDFIRRRYGVVTWRIFLIISLCYGFGWLMSMGMAGGLLIEALTDLPYFAGVTIILVICVGYTLLGGLRAVIATDFIQTLIILVGLCGLAIWVLIQVEIEPIHAQLQAERPQLLNLLFPAAIMFLFNNVLFGVGEIFHSNVWWSRALAFADGVGTRAYWLAGLFWLPVPIIAGVIALSAPAIGLSVPSADMVGPLVAGHLLGQLGAILVFVVVFAALASSLDSLLAASTDLVVQDIYRGHLRPQATEAECVQASRWVVVLLGLLTWGLCSLQLTTLASLLHFMGAFVASTIWPVLFGLRGGRATGQAASWAMLLGTASGLWAYFAVGFYVAALVSAAVSLGVMWLLMWHRPGQFAFESLAVAESRS